MIKKGGGNLVNGNTNLSTPNIDDIAKSEASFQNFYVNAVCSPTRAEFLTKRVITASEAEFTALVVVVKEWMLTRPLLQMFLKKQDMKL